MRTRNLRVLHIDDQGSATYPKNIDLVTIETVNGLPSLGISEWDQHCDNLAIEKEIIFDLLTIDINFERDTTDPQNIFSERVNNVGGLYHGMMALARRSNYDAFGNAFPLAWEIRSVSPQIFLRDHIRAEAIRAYGLLRALLAEPNPNEPLIDCIIRENIERISPPLTLEGRGRIAEIKGKSLAVVMEWELENQIPQTGAGIGATNRLLRLWRSKFLRAVKNGAVRVDRNRLSQTVNDLVLATANYNTVSLTPALDMSISIVDWRGNECDGIRIWSILADLVDYSRGATLDIRSESVGAINSEGRGISIIGWLSEVLQSTTNSDGHSNINYWVKLGRQINDWGKVPHNNRPPFWGTPYEKKCMVYCFLLLRTLVLPNKYPECDDAELAHQFKISHNDQTFLRPFRETNFGLCNTAEQFRRTLKEAIVQSDHSLFTDVPWLKEVLIRFCREVLNVPESILRSNAPGLFQ